MLVVEAVEAAGVPKENPEDDVVGAVEGAAGCEVAAPKFNAGLAVAVAGAPKEKVLDAGVVPGAEVVVEGVLKVNPPAGDAAGAAGAADAAGAPNEKGDEVEAEEAVVPPRLNPPVAAGVVVVAPNPPVFCCC